MNKLVLAAIRCSLLFGIPTVTYAISAQWDLDPISGDWNTAANWTPMGVPNGPADTATLGLSNTTDVSISADTEVNSITFTSAATNPYTITANPRLTLTISGSGITNNLEDTQNFVTTADASGNIGTIVFSHNATAGSNVSISNKGGTTSFFDTSTAPTGEFGSISNNKGGTTNFFDRSTGFASNFGEGTTNFFDRSSGFTQNFGEGGTTNFFNRSSGSVQNFGDGDTTNFFDRSTGNVFYSGGGTTNFFDRSSGGVNSIAGGVTNFLDRSTCLGLEVVRGVAFVGGSASLGANAGVFVSDDSSVFFGGYTTTGNRFGNAGMLEIFAASNAGIAFIGNSGLLSIGDGYYRAQIELQPSFTNFVPSIFSAGNLTIGSLAGGGKNFEGQEAILSMGNLTIGSNNLSTSFSGVITGGSLTKIGSGTLILSGTNTYTGNTNVRAGVLKVDGSITSDTFVRGGGTLAGTGTINGNVMNNGKVSLGDSPGMLTVVHNYTQAQYATLMIQIAGMSPEQFSVLNVLGNASLNGFLDPVLLNGFVPTLGDSFTFLNYASFTGAFSQIQNQVFSLWDRAMVSHRIDDSYSADGPDRARYYWEIVADNLKKRG
jgi:autotransporter-associated beta strand protein